MELKIQIDIHQVWDQLWHPKFCGLFSPQIPFAIAHYLNLIHEVWTYGSGCNLYLKLLLLYFVMSQLDNLTQFCVLSQKSQQIYRQFILYFRSSKNPCLEMTFLWSRVSEFLGLL